MKQSTKELSAQWDGSHKTAIQKLRFILEGKAKCDEQSRAALAFVIEYHDPTPTIKKYTARCPKCNYYFCDCPHFLE